MIDSHCVMDHENGEFFDRCRCGIYALDTPAGTRGYGELTLDEGMTPVMALVRGYGHVVKGSKGWRAEHAEVIAVSPSPAFNARLGWTSFKERVSTDRRFDAALSFFVLTAVFTNTPGSYNPFLWHSFTLAFVFFAVYLSCAVNQYGSFHRDAVRAVRGTVPVVSFKRLMEMADEETK